MKIRAAVLLFVLAPAAFGQPALPDTPAGKVFGAWLAAFNSGDAAKVSAFRESHWPDAPPAENTLGFRERTGGFTLLRIETSEPRTLVALPQEKSSAAGAGAKLTF